MTKILVLDSDENFRSVIEAFLQESLLGGGLDLAWVLMPNMAYRIAKNRLNPLAAIFIGDCSSDTDLSPVELVCKLRGKEEVGYKGPIYAIASNRNQQTALLDVGCGSCKRLALFAKIIEVVQASSDPTT